MTNVHCNVLMVKPDAFHLGWMGATMRLFHLAYAFRALGFNVALLTGKITNAPVQAEIDRRFPGLVVRTYHTGAYPRILDCAPLPRQAWRAFWKVYGPAYYAARLSYGWAQTLDLNNVMELLQAKAFRPDLIWGVCGGYLDGGEAAEKIALSFGVQWIFELHDPPRWCGLSPEMLSVHREFERLLKSSVRQVVTSESYRGELIRKFGLDPGAIHTIYLTYEGELGNPSAPGRDANWRLVYAGSLQGGRSVTPALYGLIKAIDCKPCLKDSLLFDIAGIGYGMDEGEELSRRLGLGRSVRFIGQVGRERAEQMLELADVLIMVQTKGTHYFQIPGKMFQYMRQAKPILSIMPECEAAGILRRSGLAFVHCPEDVDGIAGTLIRLWSDWRARVHSVQVDRDFVNQFSVKSLPKKLSALLEGVT